MQDPYTVLGVAKTASEAEIKKAFRQLAKKHHPDTHPGDEGAKKKFQEISAAYDVVGDKDKRAKFDRGEIDASGNPRGFDPGGGFRPGGQGPFGGGNPRDFQYTWQNQDGANTAEGFRAEDIFSDLFGGMGGGRAKRRNQPQRGEDYEMGITIGFEEAARGGTRRMVLPTGSEGDVRIPAGVRDGQQIRLRGQGAAGRSGGPNGDLLLSVTVAPHPFFTRDGNDVKMDLPITLKEAVLGGKVSAPTLGGTVQLTIPPNSNTGAVLRLKGKGLPGRGTSAGGEQAGDLYVKLVVTLPDKPDADLQKFTQSWALNYDPRAKLK